MISCTSVCSRALAFPFSPVCSCSRSKFMSKNLKIIVKNFPEIFPEFFFCFLPNLMRKIAI
nr:MAG TPA: hypothetical protein [Caudoviricetes sp.]